MIHEHERIQALVTKAAGLLTGSSFAAWWSWSLIADVAGSVAQGTREAGAALAPVRPPTLAEVAAAQGMITWLLFVAASLLGAAVWAGKHANDDPASRWTKTFLRAASGAAAWGIVWAAVELHYGMDPLLVGASCILAGLLSELMTAGAVKVAGQIAANPLRAWRYYREGKIAEIEDHRAFQERRDAEKKALDDTWQRRNREEH